MASAPESLKKVPDLVPPGKAQRLEAGTVAAPKTPASPKPPTPAKAPKEPKPPKEPKAPRTSALKKAYPDNGVITLLVEGNPKRAGTASFDRFAQYKTGMTIKQAVDAGVIYNDFSWDVGHNFIRVDIPPTPAEVTPAAVSQTPAAE